MNNSTPVKKNYNSIDLAKFVCAILVVMIHVAPFGESANSTIVTLNFAVRKCLARTAVPFFFIASGFFLYRKTSFKKFEIGPSIKYVKRLAGLYLIWSLIYFPLNLILFRRDSEGMVHALLLYIRNFFFAGSYGHLWYLTALIFAVLLTSFLLSRGKSIKTIICLASIFYLAGLLDQSWYGLIRPLSTACPFIWKVLEAIMFCIVNTRDGLFDGFLFVSIGALFSQEKVKISKPASLIGFLVSLLLLFTEAFTLRHFNFIKNYDMYIFLVPTTFFAFSYVKQAELADSGKYKTLRKLSTLIYFMQLWVSPVAEVLLARINPAWGRSWLRFVLTLAITIILGLIVIALSEKKPFRWMKRLYS